MKNQYFILNMVISLIFFIFITINLINKWGLEFGLIVGSIFMVIIFIFLIVIFLKNKRKEHNSSKSLMVSLEKERSIFIQLIGSLFLIGAIYNLVTFIQTPTLEKFILTLVAFSAGFLFIFGGRMIARFHQKILRKITFNKL